MCRRSRRNLDRGHRIAVIAGTIGMRRSRRVGRWARKPEAAEKTVASNRRARHDYDIQERFEAVIGRRARESLRQGGRPWPEPTRPALGWPLAEQMHPPYEQGEKRGYDPLRAEAPRTTRRQHLSSAEGPGLSLSRCACTSPTAWPRNLELGLGRGKREAGVVDVETPGRARDGTRRRSPSLASSPVRRLPYTSVTTAYGGVLASTWTFIDWEKRAEIPDVSLNAGSIQAPITTRSLLN